MTDAQPDRPASEYGSFQHKTAKEDRQQKRVLLLQGPASWFFRDLGRALMSRNAEVTRLGFAPGDRLFWSRDAGTYVRCGVAAKTFGAWIADFLTRYCPTDIVMLGDQRFYHRVTLEAARALGSPPRTHIVEHGYLRPGWLLVEPSGTGKDSAIPEAFKSIDAVEPAPNPSARGAAFAQYAFLDVLYNGANTLIGWAYNRHYVRHSLDSTVKEYSGWVVKAIAKPYTMLADRRSHELLVAMDGSAPIFLFPLQLETDFQIRSHGKGKTVLEHLEEVVASFAAHAPQDAHLIVKRHPLDNGLARWRKRTANLARYAGVAQRVIYFDGGDLDGMLKKADGVVTINSTVGLTAVLAGVPCHVRGVAVYDLEALTHRSTLDAFWTKPTKPSHDAAHGFRAMLLNQFHIQGAFDGPGSRIGADALAARICQ